jgi:hypothetical protein
MRLLPALTALVVLGAAVLTAQAQEHPAQDSGKIRVAKFLYVPKPAPRDVVVFKYPERPGTPAAPNYLKRLVGLPGETIVIKDGSTFRSPGPVIERITIEGGKVEISGDTIKIEGGRVEITRQSRP